MFPEIPDLAGQAAPLILPALPYLLQGIRRVPELVTALGQKAGEVDWEVVFKIWDRIRPQVEQQPEVKQRIEEVAQKAEDPRGATMLSWELEKVLAALQPDELTEINALLNQSKTETRVTVARNRSVVSGGDMKDNTIITGDRNKVEK